MVKMIQNLNEDQLEKHLEKSWSISEKIAKIKHLAGKNWDEWQMLPLALEWARKGELLILNQATPPVVKKNQLRRV